MNEIPWIEISVVILVCMNVVTYTHFKHKTDIMVSIQQMIVDHLRMKIQVEKMIAKKEMEKHEKES